MKCWGTEFGGYFRDSMGDYLPYIAMPGDARQIQVKQVGGVVNPLSGLVQINRFGKVYILSTSNET